MEDIPEELRAAQHEPTPEELTVQRKAQHDAAFAKHSESLEFIRALIAKGDLNGARTEWAAITPQTDQMALWLATTKGGWFTTAEREILSASAAKPETLSDADREILAGAPR